MPADPKKLYLRPVPNPRLQRPTREHPSLGGLEFINQDGGWWQGAVHFGAEHVRIDIQKMSPNIDPAAIDRAVTWVYWVRENYGQIVSFVEQRLRIRNVDNLEADEIPSFSEADFQSVRWLRPYMIVCWDDFAEIRNECDLSPGGTCAGFRHVQVEVRSSGGRIEPVDLRLTKGDSSTMAAYILQRPIPREIAGFENSLPDRFVSTAAVRGWFRFDAELWSQLSEASRLVDQAMASTSDESRRYLRSVQLMLKLIADEAKAESN